MLIHKFSSLSFGLLKNNRVAFRNQFNSIRLKAVAALMSTSVNISYQSLSKALELVTAAPVKLSPGPPPTLLSDKPRPLVVMLAWISAKRKHLHKYCELYVKRGCDVLTVRITPWQLLWPMRGSQLVAEEVLQFLHQNVLCQPLLLHGFSIGGYVWGEVMVKMSEDKERYQPIIDRIVGQTWDSAADITDMQEGMPLAVFPHNIVLRMALSKYITYHLKTYNKEATIHYLRSSQIFHKNLVHSPALMLLSKTDPIGSMSSNQKVRETWQSMGIEVTWKCWEDSKHVSHFLQHRDEYVEVLETFLNNLERIPKPETRHVLNSDLKEKLQAKL